MGWNNTKIKEILNKYPKENRYFKKNEPDFADFKDNSCVFGMPILNDPLESIEDLPKTTKGLYFYYGASIQELLEEIIRLGFNETLEHLTIGFQHGNYGVNYSDYSEISNILSNTNFPKLETFEYGIDYLLVNEDMYYGNLGNLTGALSNMPNLKTLELCGIFELDKRINLKNLKHLTISHYWVTDEKIGFVSNDTLQFFLDSDFKYLEELIISLEKRYDNQFKCAYLFPDTFFDFKKISKLKYVDIEGNFLPGTKQKIEKILNGKVEKVYLDEITER